MHYCLGVDIGNSAVTAAVADGAGVETVGLGRHTPSLPALVHVTPDGTILTGDDAVRANELEPTWTARMLARRLDDPAPLQLGERTCEVTDLVGTVLWDVLDRVGTLRGGPPDHVVLTRPAALGPRGRDVLAAAVARAGRPDATTTTAPLALGTWFAGTGRSDGRFAVYDFGGGAFETAVLRADTHGVELVCPPDGVPRLGGADLDELVRAHLDTRLGGALARWDPRTRDGARTRDRVLAACATAKETLSTQGVVEMTLPLPSGARRSQLRREDIDALFRRPVTDTVEALRRVLAAAGARPNVLVLSGGSARIPLVTSLLRDALGPGVRIENAPDGAVAWGAAQLATRRAGSVTPHPALGRPLARGPSQARRPAPPVSSPLPPPPVPSPTPPARPAAPPPAQAIPPAPSPPPPVPRPVPPVPRPPHPAPVPRSAPSVPPPTAGPPRSGVPPAGTGRGAPAGPHPPGPHTPLPDQATERVPGLPAPAPAAGPDAHPTAEPPARDGDGNEHSWRNPAIGRPLAVALALLAVIVAIVVIIFVVLNRIKGATAGLVAPQSLVEAWWTYLGPRY